MKKINRLIVQLIQRTIRLVSLCNSKDCILFVPHPGMCKVDRYSVINYKSDSALTFLHYIFDNNLLDNKQLFVAVADDMDTGIFDKFIKDKYPTRQLFYLAMFSNRKLTPPDRLKSLVHIFRCVGKCSHIFASISYDFSGSVSSNQILVDLNYFTAPMKNDIQDPRSPHYTGVDKAGHEYTYFIGTSEIAIRLTLPEMTVPYMRFVNLGLCRNDNVLNGDKCEWLRKEIQDKISYKIEKIILYTPTHRDYESALKSGNRSILGFNYDAEDICDFLKLHGIVFICKLHPKQNALVVEKELPEGLLLHKPDERYGLTELMQVSDALVTDYTSTYFDYLLLDKPIIFNFYDLDVYKKERGVPCEPMSAISAGDIVENVKDLKIALINLDKNYQKYKEMRSFVRNLFFTNQDMHTCERVYNFIFAGK